MKNLVLKNNKLAVVLFLLLCSNFSHTQNYKTSVHSYLLAYNWQIPIKSTFNQNINCLWLNDLYHNYDSEMYYQAHQSGFVIVVKNLYYDVEDAFATLENGIIGVQHTHLLPTNQPILKYNKVQGNLAGTIAGKKVTVSMFVICSKQETHTIIGINTDDNDDAIQAVVLDFPRIMASKSDVAIAF